MPRDGSYRIGMFALAWVAGCGNAATAEGGDASTGAEPTTGGEVTGIDPSTGGAADGACVPGWEGCPCFEDARCISGLQCLSNHCVLVPEATSSGGIAETSTGSAESSSSSGGGPSSDGTSGDGSSTTAVADVCFDGDTYCSDDQLQTCAGGQWEFMSCEDHCSVAGYSAGACGDSDRCACDGHIDEVCDAAAYNHCLCIEALYGVVPCGEAQREAEYQACFAEMTDANMCWAAWTINVIEDCEMAVAGCGA